jgi:hypothetical protein
MIGRELANTMTGLHENRFRQGVIGRKKMWNLQEWEKHKKISKNGKKLDLGGDKKRETISVSLSVTGSLNELWFSQLGDR